MTADLGDARLHHPLEFLLSALGQRPNLSIPAACGGRSETTAAYRFFDNPKVSFDNVRQPHADHTLLRVAEPPVALLVQDTTEIDVSRPESAVHGAGELDGVRRGVLAHLLHAFRPDGTPLGTVWAEIVNRTEAGSHAPKAEKEREKKRPPIEGQESLRWLTGLRKAREVAERLPDISCVRVADSEADLAELFAEPRGPLQVLVRACQDRAAGRGRERTCGGRC